MQGSPISWCRAPQHPQEQPSLFIRNVMFPSIIGPSSLIPKQPVSSIWGLIVFIYGHIYLMHDKRAVDAVAALPVHEKCLFCEVLGDNFVSGLFSLKLIILEFFPHRWRFNLCRYRDMSLFGVVREANVAFIF